MHIMLSVESKSLIHVSFCGKQMLKMLNMSLTMTFRGHWRIMYIALVELAELVQKEQHTPFSPQLMPDLQRNLSIFWRKLVKRSALN
jgi:hypothetical protein